MEAGVEMPVDSSDARLELRLLGPLAIRRDGVALALPASRKVRALLAYLTLAPRAVTRGHLCELLWDVPNDPRGELRWCLSKIRGLLDEAGHHRVVTHDNTVALDLSGGFVDAIEVARAADARIDTLPVPRQRALSTLFEGDFLEGLEIDRCPLFSGWLTAQRRRFRGCQAALLEQLATGAPADAALPHPAPGLQRAPCARRAHQLRRAARARLGRIREGEQHLAATVPLFEAEGLDSVPLRRAWQSSRGAAPALVLREPPAPQPAAVAAQRRASIAVMPFADRSTTPGERGGTADALAHDVITRLAKLRSMFVIAQGTVFALHERRIGAEEAGRMLDVDYVVGGSVRVDGARIAVSVELAETRTARTVWAETFNQALGDALDVLEQIGNRIVALVSGEVELLERNRAILRPPSSLDAWEAHHRGLWHMYRFNRPDNEQAQHFFEMAVRLDPTFARAWAGLSFTHFQNAFQGWSGREPAVDRAFATAGQSLMVDDRDPAAHWAMGRALWLRGNRDESIAELERAIDLSPNFALGHYTLAFVHSQAGDPAAAIAASDHSRHLSPFDPLLFGMLGARAMALVRLGRYDEAADWALKAAARPNAHPHIFAIAACSLALAGRPVEAAAQLAAIRRLLPRYELADFLRAFHFDAQGEALFRDGAGRTGMA